MIHLTISFMFTDGQGKYGYCNQESDLGPWNPYFKVKYLGSFSN